MRSAAGTDLGCWQRGALEARRPAGAVIAISSASERSLLGWAGAGAYIVGSRHSQDDVAIRRRPDALMSAAFGLNSRSFRSPGDSPALGIAYTSWWVTEARLWKFRPTRPRPQTGLLLDATEATASEYAAILDRGAAPNATRALTARRIRMSSVWHPQRDSNPCYRLERAASWATGRWGPGSDGTSAPGGPSRVRSAGRARCRGPRRRLRAGRLARRRPSPSPGRCGPDLAPPARPRRRHPARPRPARRPRRGG